MVNSGPKGLQLSTAPKPQFPVVDRVDDIPQPWEFTIHDQFDTRTELWDIEKQLL